MAVKLSPLNFQLVAFKNHALGNLHHSEVCFEISQHHFLIYDVEKLIHFHHIIQHKRNIVIGFYSYTPDDGQKRPKHVV
jgi:hypothetical protein